MSATMPRRRSRHVGEDQQRGADFAEGGNEQDENACEQGGADDRALRALVFAGPDPE